jgi:hypothetical protein
MASNLIWNAGKVMEAYRRQVGAGVDKATAFLATTAKYKVGQVGARHMADRSAVPSSVGEPPHKVTGNLQRNIASDRAQDLGDRIVGHFGVRGNVAYARRLERGFVGVDSRGRNIHQGPRPFLRPALLENRDKILRIISSGGAVV